MAAVMATMALGAAAGCVAAEQKTTPGSSQPADLSSPGFSQPAASSSRPAVDEEPGAVPWVGTWATAVQPGGRAFERQTLRQIVHTSIGGGSARIRLSNAYGRNALTLTGVHLARSVRGDAVDAATGRSVTFGGADSVTIPAGGMAVSDEVEFAVPVDGDVAISAYLPVATGVSTRHTLATRHNYVAAGEQSSAERLSGAARISSYFFLAGLDVRNEDADGAVVTFGASITDGLGSRFGANRRWPDLLSDRLRASGRIVGVLNSGISGNRLTGDTHGESAAKRFDRDVLQQPGARWVIISDEALNDLGMADMSTPVLVGALEELIERGHGAGLTVICSTLTPFRGAGYWTQRGEDGRAAFNTFVRSAGSGCDAVLDQDAVTRDPGSPGRFLAGFDSGDHLHPGDRGMGAIADAVPLKWF
ncbi:GDSL-type esterase/lipase family protein [Actinoplanes sp. GCM10030250]|uniref:GDSL-type esterase/lipase family protein n=1 Tax=Actinoplanes sp. GCM10030250 TaxID=3273376 RepID=UPI0036175198